MSNSVTLGYEPRINVTRFVRRVEVRTTRLASESEIEIPVNHRFLSAGYRETEGDEDGLKSPKLVLYVEVEDVPAGHRERRARYRVVPVWKGWSVPAGLVFVDTVVDPLDGQVLQIYVGHPINNEPQQRAGQ